MLSLKFTVEEGLRQYSISAAPLACTPQRVLRIRVRFATPLALVANFILIHFNKKRPNFLRLVGTVLLGIVLAIGFFYSQSFMASGIDWLRGSSTSSRSAQGVHCLPPDCIGAKANAYPETLVIAISPLLIGVFGFALYFLRRSLIDVYVIPLKPHEPFPVVERFLARSHDRHVFAIRFLSEAAERKYFGPFTNFDADSSQVFTSLCITHRNSAVERYRLPSRMLHVVGYWSIIRYSIGLMIEEHLPSKPRALAFTYKQHEFLFIAYFWLVGFVVVTPNVGLLPSDFQLPIFVAGIGFVWAITFLLINRGISNHLAEWERMTADVPFMGCPIYRYSEREDPDGRWDEVDVVKFQSPIREFGLPADQILQLTIGVLLVVLLTILQIVK